MMEESGQPLERDPLQGYRQGLHILEPDENGKIHKDRIRDYFKATIGHHFDEDVSKAIVDHMEADENGMVSIDGFMEAFSTKYWTAENLADMHDVLENQPDLLKSMVDWKSVLDSLGLERSEDEIDELIAKARACAADLLSAQIKDRGIGESTGGGIVNAVKEKLHLMDIGAVSQDQQASESSQIKETD